MAEEIPISPPNEEEGSALKSAIINAQIDPSCDANDVDVLANPHETPGNEHAKADPSDHDGDEQGNDAQKENEVDDHSDDILVADSPITHRDTITDDGSKALPDVLTMSQSTTETPANPIESDDSKNLKDSDDTQLAEKDTFDSENEEKGHGLQTPLIELTPLHGHCSKQGYRTSMEVFYALWTMLYDVCPRWDSRCKYPCTHFAVIDWMDTNQFRTR